MNYPYIINSTSFINFLITNYMNQYDQQKFLVCQLLQGDDLQETSSYHSDRDSQKIMAFSAPPILFDIGARFYEDFIEEMAQSDPELDKQGFLKSWNKKSQQNVELPTNNYRKFSLQAEEYNSYFAVQMPAQQYYHSTPTPEDEILNNLDKAARWARDQYGSRIIQSIIQNGEPHAKNAVFESLIKECIQLTKDKFGNYVFQKIFELGEQEHKLKLFNLIKLNILSFSNNGYGCRVVQKAIQYTINYPQLQREIVQLVQPYCLYLIQNINGNHVMQKCFQVIELEFLTNIIKVITDKYQTLSLHAYGCRVIQKYLEKLHHQQTIRQQKLFKNQNSKEASKMKEQISKIRNNQKIMFDKLLAISVELSQCQYGNYVMQHIVTFSKEYKSIIEDIFLNNFVCLSCNKYASNVMEKVIKLSSLEYKQKLVKHLCQSDSFVYIVKHQYGNYVIQSLIKKISSQSYANLKLKLRQNSQQISKSQYGRHVLIQLQKNK